MGYFLRHLAGAIHSEDALRRIVTEIELIAAARLARLHLGVRLGPLLGLMGTLIPLGPALMGLTDMQIGVIAENLVVAFATTVVVHGAFEQYLQVLLPRGRWTDI